MDRFKIAVVEDVALELKGTLSILKSDIPEAEVAGTASNERELWPLLSAAQVDMVLLDLGLGGSTTIGVDICRRLKKEYPAVRVLVFTGEILNEQLWVDVLEAGADGIALKTGEMLTREIVAAVMSGRCPAFNQPILTRIVERYKQSVRRENSRRNAFVKYDIDEYDERLLRHLALGYTKDMISELRTMPFSSKSLEKRQQDLTGRLFSRGEQNLNVTRLVARAIELQIIDPATIEADE